MPLTMSSTNAQNLSLSLCTILDSFGYSKEQIELRSKEMDYSLQKIEITANSFFKYSLLPELTYVSAGSTGEGIRLSDSDIDYMNAFQDIICVDEGFENSVCVVLESDRTSTAPGYTKIVLISNLDSFDLRTSSMIEKYMYLQIMSKYRTQSGKKYISSEQFKGITLDAMNLFGLKIFGKCSGPAFQPNDDLKVQIDSVISIYFYGGNYLNKWTNRSRNHAWPTSEVVNEVSQMEGYIVPIGDKQSDMQAYEWRICYTTAEKRLVSSLSDTQLKAYVLLKIMAKTLLKPRCNFLTSYVVKNVIFWVMEMSDSCELSPSHLVNLIQKAIFFIKHCVINNHLPNYMIPERNLLRGDVFGKDKVAIISFLSDCLEEGGSILLKVPKLYHCVALSISKPDLFPVFRKWRDETERILCLLTECIYDFSVVNLVEQNPSVDGLFNSLPRRCMSDNKTVVAFEKLFIHVVPDLWSLECSGTTEEDIYQIFLERLKLLKIL
ncbi:uncharacterized protein LOC132740754 [Ruditapes philippinarum]|uniref:uncharacterized protein LOC132740754 n=1 Tax=Ruditapes philippinarum TaxID=129788 RepID=UPI00295AED37|nr:uncharacterized protein LOC132740754 [Ruditapes philippinarum]